MEENSAHFFEGTEKLLEVWFSRQDDSKGTGDLRSIPRLVWGGNMSLTDFSVPESQILSYWISRALDRGRGHVYLVYYVVRLYREQGTIWDSFSCILVKPCALSQYRAVKLALCYLCWNIFLELL